MLRNILGHFSNDLSIDLGTANTLIYSRGHGVVLDEPSSRLDPATEEQIDRAVEQLLVGRTAIIIAHHLGTVQRVDDIAILTAGRIEEYGARQQLAQDPQSHFARLLAVGLEEYTG